MLNNLQTSHNHNMEVLRTLALLVSALLVSVDSVMFHLEANARKCLAEEIRQNILVTGEFEVSEAPGQQVRSNKIVLVYYRQQYAIILCKTAITFILD